MIIILSNLRSQNNFAIFFIYGIKKFYGPGHNEVTFLIQSIRIIEWKVIMHGAYYFFGFVQICGRLRGPTFFFINIQG